MYDGMIIGMQKRRIERYQSIVKILLEKQELSEEDKEFLRREKIIFKNPTR